MGSCEIDPSLVYCTSLKECCGEGGAFSLENAKRFSFPLSQQMAKQIQHHPSQEELRIKHDVALCTKNLNPNN